MIVIAFMILVSCSAQAITTPTASTAHFQANTLSPPLPTATRDASIAQNPAVDLSLTATPELPEVFVEDFLFSGFEDDCRFTCWYDLRIGDSSRSEVDALLRDRFGINYPTPIYEEATFDFPSNVFWLGNTWRLGDSLASSFTIAFAIGRDSNKLLHIFFDWQALGVVPPSPRHVLEQLGKPAYIGIDNIPTSAVVYLIYDAGLLLQYRILQNPFVLEETGTYGEQLCLDNARLSSASGEVSLGEPIHSFDRLPTLYNTFHGSDFSTTKALDDLYGVTLDQLMERVKNQESLCLRTPSSTNP